jgi:hypothetical protein
LERDVARSWHYVAQGFILLMGVVMCFEGTKVPYFLPLILLIVQIGTDYFCYGLFAVIIARKDAKAQSYLVLDCLLWCLWDFF